MPVPVCLFRRKDRSCAHSFRAEHQAGRSPSGRLDPFCAPLGNDRYFAHCRRPSIGLERPVSSQRCASTLVGYCSGARAL